MKKRLTKTALFLKDEQTTSLKKISQKTGAPMSELIRRAIDAYLKNYKAA